MIANPLIFVLILSSAIIGIKSLEKYSRSRFFEYIPAIAVIYFVMMIIGSVGLFETSLTKRFGELKSYILPAMIFLMLSSGDIRAVYRMKGRLLASFFAASISIMAAFVLTWIALGGFFAEGAHKAFGSLCASWIGGTANMVAVASAVGLDGSFMGYCLIADSVCYTAWLAFLLFSVGYKERFNAWAKTTPIASENLGRESKEKSEKWSRYAIISAVFASFVIVWASNLLPVFSFATKSFWIVVLSTILGVAASFSPLNKSEKSEKVGFWLLYALIALIAVDSSFGDFGDAWLFIVAGFMVIAIHAVLLIFYARIFGADLFSIGVASLANIGGVASAPLLAASFDKNLVSVGVVMSMLGYIIGTFCGIAMTYALEAIRF